VSGLFHRQH